MLSAPRRGLAGQLPQRDAPQMYRRGFFWRSVPLPETPDSGVSKIIVIDPENSVQKRNAGGIFDGISEGQKS